MGTGSQLAAGTTARPNIPHAVRHVAEEYRRFLRTSYRFLDDRLRQQFEAHLAGADVVVKGPYVTLARDYARGRTLKQLVEAGHAERVLLRARWAFGDAPLFEHQEAALLAGRAGRSLVVTTGTGSGKTEAFLLPVFDGISRRKRESVRGVQAVLLYPMNALANDQIERLRRMLRGTGLDLSFALYTGDSEKTARLLKEEPAETERLTRAQIQRDPPDILLTNYKQLEFLLVRKEDRGLFTPALRFLVLDELHTYRGALATEIACLLRRLKAHAGLQPGALVALGTSATVASGPDGVQALASFATTLFGETILPGDVIHETSVPFVDPAAEWTPPPPGLTDADILAVGPDDDGAIVALAEKLTGRRCPASGALAERIGSVLAGNAIVRALEAEATAPIALDDLAVRVLARLPSRANAPTVDVRRELEAYLLVGSAYDSEDHPPRLRPKLHSFFHGVYDIGLCLDPACRTLVPHGAAECPKCGSKAWPAALCRTCGQDFVKVRFPTEDRTSPVGSGDFFSDPDSTAFLTHAIFDTSEDDDAEGAEPPPTPGKRARTDHDLDPVGVCLKCGRLGDRDKACPGCTAPFAPMWRKDGKINTCPACGDISTRRDIVTPLRTGTASSVSVLTTHHLDHLRDADRKLLVFADNRQDAAHQSAYTEDKHRSFALRHLIADELRKAPGATLHLSELPQRLFDRYRGLRIIEGRPDTPTTRMWTDLLGLETGWEFTRRSRQRNSIEHLGLVAVDYEFLDELRGEPKFQQAAAAAGLDPERALILVRAVLDLMRKERAVSLPFFQRYIDPSQRPFRELALEPYKLAVPETDRRPCGFALDRPDHIRKNGRLKGLFQENPKVGNLPGPQQLVGKLVGGRQRAQEFLAAVVPLLLEATVLVAVPDLVPAKERTPGLTPLQINCGIIRLHAVDDGYRCGSCRTWRPYTLEACAKPRCKAGAPSRATVDRDDYYVRLYVDQSPRRLKVAEHTAQISGEDRAELETRFKGRDLDALVCSPTLELGVDIGPLLTVVLRNAPPTPANYAQRVGRAGRRLRIGFASTFCIGSAHDRHAFEHPEWLVAGRFDPPRLRLDNVRIVHRHLRSYLLTCLEHELPKRMGELLDDPRRPTAWKREVVEPLLAEVDARREDLVQRLAAVMAVDRAAGRTERFDEAEARALVHEFRQKLTGEIELWWSRVSQLDKEYSELSAVGSSRFDERKARARKRAFLEITFDPQQAYTLNYLSTRDLLPAYQFPVDSFTLDPGVDDTPTLHRSAGIALVEFAPGNYVYANGHKLRSIRVLFSGRVAPGQPAERHAGAEGSGRLESYQFCSACEEAVEATKNHCPRCNHTLDRVESLLFVNAFEAEEADRIGSDEESRQRQRSVRRDSLIVPPDASVTLLPYALAPIEVVRHARVLLTNWGREAPGSPSGDRFLICPECGRQQPYHPHDTQHADKLGKWAEYHRKFCQGTPQDLVLAYRYDTDAAILTIPQRGDVQPDEPASRSPFLVTLTESLVAAATVLLEIEPGELSAFPRKGPPGSLGDQVVFYEDVPGGAGYVEEFARRLPAVAATAIERLYQHDCARACYLCLKHYGNQRWHETLDKNAVRDVLGILAEVDGVNPEPVPPGAGMGTLGKMIDGELAARTAPTYAKGPIEEPLLLALRKIPDLPEPLRDHELRDDKGVLVTVPDFSWPDVQLAVYCDGYAHHGGVETLALDARKRNWLQGEGWAVLVYWGRTIMKNPQACAAQMSDVHRKRRSHRSGSPGMKG